ncbi:MipA/OmpV family protein [Paludibacterium sp.]|uniref:MipA/OmpV family protein n=1 Tax=Paludibacterium sp. TaxID=1917523 RepID=UPI0025D6EE67|nr:MipA/OmpV family protein [Paludibacterium sp.]MBV8648785.1 MipA/OmpV family protein [Paludibacterium sp.]
MRDSLPLAVCALGALFLANVPAAAMTHDGKPSSDWRVTAGAGVSWKPEVMGGSFYRARPVPNLDVEHRDGWFFNLQDGAGKKWQLSPDLVLSTFFAVSDAREESAKIDRDTTLSGMGDIDRVVQAGLAMTYQLGNWQWQARYLGNLKHGQPGQQLKLGADYTILKSPSAALTLNSALTAGDSHYSQRWFGVSDEQAAKTPFAAYRTGAGWTQGSLGATLLLPIDRHWQAVGRVSYVRQLGHTEDSPLIRNHGYGTATALAQYAW